MPQTEESTVLAADYDLIPDSDAEPKKYNLGAGKNADGTVKEIPGYIPVDRVNGKEVFPLDIPDDSADELLASHVLEHFPMKQVGEIIKHWTGKLKPGGILKIAVPDLARVIQSYQTTEPDIPVLQFIYGSQEDANDFHYCGFDAALLTQLMMDAGLEDIRRWESDHEDCAKRLGPFSLNIRGRKPSGTGEIDWSKVGGILAAPRLSYTMHVWCTQRALGELAGLKFNIIQGCFWHQQLCEGMQKHVDAGCEYVLTLDYDTVFEPNDIRELYRLLQARPEADAVVALQSKRGTNEVLFSLPDNTSTQVATAALAQPMTRIGTGHFGLTLFRASSLKSFPHPWMTPLPGPDGQYGEGHKNVDADINFWHRWRDAGKTLFLANRVPVGHIEEKIKWPAAQSDQPIYQGVQDYSQQGKPKGVWI